MCAVTLCRCFLTGSVYQPQVAAWCFYWGIFPDFLAMFEQYLLPDRQL